MKCFVSNKFPLYPLFAFLLSFVLPLLQVALLALVAVASGKSYFQGFPHMQPGLQTPYATGFQGIGTPFAPLAPHTGMFNPMFNPYLLNQGGLRFKRSADSDSDSFYPGFPFVPPPAYGTPFNQGFYPNVYGASPFTPAIAPSAAFNPMVRPYATYGSHPFIYNPLLKIAEDKKEHTVEKRESESESYYPGFPWMPPTAAAYGTPYGIPYGYQQPSLPSVVPRVLPYNFPAAFPQQQYYSPVYRPVMAIEKAEKVEQQ